MIMCVSERSIEGGMDERRKREREREREREMIL
jgi:hypothetical protein